MTEEHNGTTISGGNFNAKAMNFGQKSTINMGQADDTGKKPEEQPPSAEKQREINLFYAYAPQDENLHKELEKHLATLRRQGWIREWRALDVQAGRPQAEVNDYIERSQIILLLISPDLLASDRLYKDQVERALRMQAKGKARVIPILLRPTGDLQYTPFGQLVVLPRNRVPVSEWRSRDKAFEEIVAEIREIIKRNFGA